MSTTLTEGTHPGESIISEASSGGTGVSRSRDAVVFGAGGGVVESCEVVSKASGGADKGKFFPLDPAGSDGKNIAAGITFAGVDSTAVEVKGTVLVRDCEHNAEEIVWSQGTTTSQKLVAIDELASLGVLVRDAA